MVIAFLANIKTKAILRWAFPFLDHQITLTIYTLSRIISQGIPVSNED